MIKRIAAISLSIAFCLTFLSACEFFSTGFEIPAYSDGLNTALIERYGFDLSAATFLSGHVHNSLRDPDIQITFRVSKDDLSGMMDENWVVEENPSSTTIEGRKSEVTYWRSGKKTAELFVTAPDSNGEVTAFFVGDNPGMKLSDL